MTRAKAVRYYMEEIARVMLSEDPNTTIKRNHLIKLISESFSDEQKRQYVTQPSLIENAVVNYLKADDSPFIRVSTGIYKANPAFKGPFVKLPVRNTKYKLDTVIEFATTVDGSSQKELSTLEELGFTQDELDAKTEKEIEEEIQEMFLNWQANYLDSGWVVVEN